MAVLYLIAVQNFAKKIKILQNRCYGEDSSNFLSFSAIESPIDYFMSPSSINAITKRLNFNEDFQRNDKHFFSNEFSSKTKKINKEIMGISPKKEINFDYHNKNQRIVEIDLTKENFFGYANYSQYYQKKERETNMNENKREVLLEKNREFDNPKKKNIFFNYPNFEFEKENKNGKFDNKEMFHSLRNSWNDDKENYNMNYSKQ